MTDEERLALSALCEELPHLRAEFAEEPQPRRELLSRIEEAARAGRPILPLLAVLLNTTRAETVRSLGARLPGRGPGHADEERYGCPTDACDRVTVPEPAGPIPTCGLTGAPMKRL